MRRPALVVALAMVVAMISTVSAHAALATAPAWTIEAVPYPSAFEPGTSYAPVLHDGPAYLVEAYDVGGDETHGVFTVTVSLPKGLLPAVGFPPTGAYGGMDSTGEPTLQMSCATLGRKITCTGGEAGALKPGEPVAVKVPVAVDASAGGTVVTTVGIVGGEAGAAESTAPTAVTNRAAPFGVIEGPGLYGSAIEADGRETTLAGSHPYAMTIAGMNLATDANTPGTGFSSLLAAGGGLRNVKVTLPRGVVVDPSATTRCREQQLEATPGECPAASQVGMVTLKLSTVEGFGRGPVTLPIYNMVPPPGLPAELAFEVVEGSYIHLLGEVSSDGSFTLSASGKEVLARIPVAGVRTTLWGVPSAESHDWQRGKCAGEKGLVACPTARTNEAFLTMPAECSGPVATSVHLTSWLGEEESNSYASPKEIEGCGALTFEPTISAKATTSGAEAPSGLEFDLHQTPNDEYENEAGEPQRATAPLRNATVTLPEGMVLNPSAANGREACSSAQLGVTTALGQTPIRYAEEPAHCPPASKLGTAEVTTPLLKEEDSAGEQVPRVLKGGVYLAKPFDNPFGTLLGIYIAIDDEETGVIAKLAGKVTANPVTGQLTTTFEESPELPLEDVKLDFFEGPRAALVTPLTCGSKETISTLTPWSTPEGADAHPTASFQVTAGCYASDAAAPAAVAFSAGITSPAAGTYSPFVLRVARNDGTQHLTGIEATLPEGLLGKIAGIPYCPESAIAQAQSREGTEMGKQEIASPSCPASSEVGVVHVTAGAGEDPIPVSGHAYLAGPYKGAPFSLVVIVPAVAGPFDLGNVVDRIALHIDEYTARVRSVADPLPTIRDGIPLDVRSIEVDVNRPGFTLNPTSCEPMAVEGAVTTEPGQTAPMSDRFQVGGCEKLPFKPSFKVSTSGKTSRANGASLHVKLTYPKAPFGTQANIKSVHVELPKALPSRLSTLNHACPNSVFTQDPAGCPSQSRVGVAKAVTPVLPVPLEGPAYFVSHGGAGFPELIVVLQGYGVTIYLQGETFISKAGITSSTFKSVPDVPVSTFELTLPQGPFSALAANTDLCAANLAMPTTFTGQNGALINQTTPIEVIGCPYALRVVHRSVKKRTLTLNVSVPQGGKLVATGKGLTRAAKSIKGRSTLTLTLKERRAGKLRTKVLLRFTPHGASGKQRGKNAKILHKSITVSFG